eukprot:TRINITY_DN59800_c0_g1_i1.p1 TRINITY_DN59800_c0_g1~~TRINITY_DN59800_c0_g1_i1.p1  ORF type:complete len:404 (-),score=30.87 TRINITY_DN59800_c0_g1_i1:72-1283(-)
MPHRCLCDLYLASVLVAMVCASAPDEPGLSLLLIDGHGGAMMEMFSQLTHMIRYTHSFYLTYICLYWYCEEAQPTFDRLSHGLPRACKSPDDCRRLDVERWFLARWFQESTQMIDADDFSREILDISLRQDFEHRFKNMVEHRFDIVVCQYPIVLCSFFLSLNVRIIVRSVMRFDYFACSAQSQDVIAADLRHIAKKGRVYVSTQFDARYFREFMNSSVQVWPSLGWHALSEAPRVNQSREEILVLPNTLRDDYKCFSQIQRYLFELKGLAARIGGPEAALRLVNVRDAYPRYELKDLAAHRTALILPYTTPTVSIAEAYALGLSLLMPSPELLARLHVERGFLCQLNSPCNGDGRIRSEDLQEWLALGEAYSWPHVRYFSSADDLMTVCLPGLTTSWHLREL